MANKKPKKQQKNKKQENLKKIAQAEIDTKASEDKISDQNELIKQLMEAAKSGDSELVENLITKQNVDVNCFDSIGKTALHYATEHSNYAVIEQLFTLKANPNIKDKDDITPLLVAIKQENIEIMELLLNNKADPNEKYYGGGTALHVVSLKHNLEMVRLLIKHHVSKDTKNDLNMTPLHAAAMYIDHNPEHWDVVKELLELGIDPNVEDYKTRLASDIFYNNDDLSYGEIYEKLVEESINNNINILGNN